MDYLTNIFIMARMGKKTLVMILAVALVFSTFSFNVTGASKCSWMCYGGSETGTNYAISECATIGKSLSVAWQTQIPAPILSQPAVDGNNLFFGTFKNVFYCLDSESGKVKWEQTIGGSVYSTPCVDGNNVYICSWDRKAYGFGKNDGKKKWSFGTELYIFNSPMLIGDWMFIGSRDEKLYCINPQTGTKSWDLRIGPVTSTPIYAEKRIFVAEHEGSIFCIDPVLRTVVWQIQTPGIIESSLAYSNGNIYVGYTSDADTSFIAISAKDGKQVWKFTGKSGLWSDPCVGEGKVFVSSENELTALKEKDGSVLWTEKLETGRFSQALGCSGKLYYGTTKNGFFMKDTETGETLYNLPVTSSVRTPCLAGNKVYFGCEDGSVYCLQGEGEKVDSMTVTPTTVTIPVNATQAFACSGKMNTGATVAKITPEWSVENPAIGTIDAEGVFTAIKPGTTNIIATYQGIKATAQVIVENYIRVTPNPIIMDKVPYGSKATVEVNIENLIKLNMNYTTTFDKPEIVKADPATGVIWPDGQKFTVTVDTTGMKPGSTHKFNLRLDYEKTWMDIPVTVTISTDSIQCIKFEPYMLDFGYISRGSTKSLDFTIHYTGVAVKGTIKPLQNWIEVSPTEFSSDNPDQRFTVTISASALPTGDNFGGSLKFEMTEGMCQQASLNVVIKTDKGIVLRLEIDNKDAYINDKKVALDVPAKLIGGRTMVPIRFISESFGCKVNWNAKEKLITIIRHDIQFQLWLGVNYAMVNGVKQPLDSPPVIVNGRTLVPLRFISEPFGAKVNWDAKTKKITVVWDPS